jgi:hypothetical protein
MSSTATIFAPEIREFTREDAIDLTDITKARIVEKATEGRRGLLVDLSGQASGRNRRLSIGNRGPVAVTA